jgi:ribonuclease P protein component
VGLPRVCRLTRKEEFDRVLKERTVQLRNGPFRVYAVSSLQCCARLGLIIGKRQAKRAVDRNRIKRALRESFRTRDSGLPALDIVVQLVASADLSSLMAEVDVLWPMLGVAFGSEDGHQKPG